MILDSVSTIIVVSNISIKRFSFWANNFNINWASTVLARVAFVINSVNGVVSWFSSCVSILKTRSFSIGVFPTSCTIRSLSIDRVRTVCNRFTLQVDFNLVGTNIKWLVRTRVSSVTIVFLFDWNITKWTSYLHFKWLSTSGNRLTILVLHFNSKRSFLSNFCSFQTRTISQAFGGINSSWFDENLESTSRKMFVFKSHSNIVDTFI
mmetsp:Transcript_1639/g.2063  ORF Transcript_1639/g.2063 Transcript_1639/m.2063 type:complete len:207 (-) Transcript_1639:1026-1646(-)